MLHKCAHGFLTFLNIKPYIRSFSIFFFFREAYPEASVVDVQFAYNISDLVKLDKNRSVFQNIIISQYGDENKHLSVIWNFYLLQFLYIIILLTGE